MDREILKHNTDSAKPASVINPDEPEKKPDLDSIHKTIAKFFTEESPFLKKSYDDGFIQLSKDNFDVLTFMNTVCILIMDSIKTENDLTSNQKVQIDNILNTHQSLLKLTKQIGTDKTSINCVVKIFSYCLNSYMKYYKKYDRQKEIPEQTHNT